jgi:phage tail sheath protein FI
MPVTPTYPGIYIEEILSNSHTITAAPTSITVFMGYTHPFKTKPQHYGEAVEIFSFSDYEREFGGLFDIDWLADDIGRAVFEFFTNGGAVGYVVALKPQFHDLGGGPTVDVTPPTLSIGTSPNAIVFTGREPVDAHHQLTVSITNPRATTGTAPIDLADITIGYGGRAETYRRVTLNPTPSAADAGNTVEKRIGTVDNPVSSLVTVSPDTAYPTAWTGALGATPLDGHLPGAPFTTYNPGDFSDAFEPDKALDKISVFNLLLTPGIWDPGVVSEALAVAERKRAFMIMDPPADAVADPTGFPLPMIGDIMSDQVSGRVIPKSENSALYFPYLRSGDPATGDPLVIPPSGFVAGVIAREDTNRGVWKAPAGYEALVSNTFGVVPSGRMTDPRQGTLNPLGVNCLRTLPGIGTVVFGARTSVAANPAFQQYRYVPVRRMALFLEQSLLASLGWVIFEPNDVPLWVSIKTTIDNFMLGLFNQGAFQGTTPSKAFQVTCDATTTTPDDQANGIVNIIVAFAPLKPAEFVIIKIAQLAGQSQS